MQDIAGCRVTVTDLTRQDLVVDQLRKLFPESRVNDRRASPSNGYRAVHVIPSIDGRTVEIQVRTLLHTFKIGQATAIMHLALRHAELK